MYSFKLKNSVVEPERQGADLDGTVMMFRPPVSATGPRSDTGIPSIP
jgi:hypothetical protein